MLFMIHLKQIFNKLKLTPEKGLFFTKNEDWYSMFSNRTQRILLDKIKPDAFFCVDKKPIILFFEKPDNKEKKLKEIWNFNECPIVFVVDESNVEVYNGFKYIFQKDSLELLANSEADIQCFDYKHIVTGDTWSKFKTNFNYVNRVDYHLLENIKYARKKLIEKNGLSIKDSNALIGKIIFVRYLIDRKVKINYLGNSKYWTNDDLCDLLKNRESVFSFFNYLEDKFNGDLFPISEEGYKIISKDCFDTLIDLLQGTEILSGQKSFFTLYDFSIIPVEFISNIYELFIGQDKQEKEGAYYTPLFLVDYILSETIEIKFSKDNQSCSCPVLDPACGSGIFLVESLRKIIEQYQKNHPNYKSDLENYKESLKKLAVDNIFGIDKDKSAVDVAVFSIYLTLLDYQTPSDIQNFTFPELLGTNFFVNDFFEKDIDGAELNYERILKNIEFDFILGNPPWKRGKGDEKNPPFVKYIDERKKRERNLEPDGSKISISNNEIAQAFLLRTSDFSSKNTKSGLIVTSKVLYNLNGENFRNYFLNNYKVDKVFELSPVRKEVFDKSNDKAVAPAAILFYRYSPNNSTLDNVVQHISLKPNISFTLFKIFTINRTDFKKVKQKQLIDFDYLWKILVYGSYLDFNFIKRLKTDFISIEKFLEKKSFIKGQGIQNGADKYPVGELKGMEFIDSRKVTPYYVEERDRGKWENEYAHRVRNKDLYHAPMLLMRKGLTPELNKISAISYKDGVFKDSLTSIKVFRQKDVKYLKMLSSLLSSRLFTYYVLHTGSSVGIEREQSFNKGVFEFPFIENNSIVSIYESLERTSKLNKHLPLNNAILENEINSLEIQMNDLIYQTVQCDEVEHSILKYTKEVTIPLIMNKKSHVNLFKSLPMKSEILSEYVGVFLKRFNSVYASRGQKLTAQVLHNQTLIGVRFNLSKHDGLIKEIDWKECNDDKLIDFVSMLGVQHITDKLFVQKDIRGFEKDGFYIIKPNEFKLWHLGIAHLDLNEFVEAILLTANKDKANV